MSSNSRTAGPCPATAFRTAARAVHFVVRGGTGKGTSTHIAARRADTTLCGLAVAGRGGGVFELNGCKRCRKRALVAGVTYVIEFDDSRAKVGAKGYWD